MQMVSKVLVYADYSTIDTDLSISLACEQI